MEFAIPCTISLVLIVKELGLVPKLPFSTPIVLAKIEFVKQAFPLTGLFISPVTSKPIFVAVVASSEAPTRGPFHDPKRTSRKGKVIGAT
jgi:hypothetical protein